MYLFATKSVKNTNAFIFVVMTLFLLLSTVGCSESSTAEFQAEGRKLMEQDNPGGAVVFFKNALDKDSQNFSIRFDLAKAYFQMGKFDQAREEFQKCLRQQPDNMDLHLEIARLATLRKSPEEALAHIEKIEQSQNPTAETQELAALNYVGLGKPELAEKALKAALAIDPARRSASASLIRVYLAQNRPKEALELSDKLLRAEPEYGEALRLRADIALAVNDIATAEKCLRKLIQLNPNEAGAHYMLATIMLRAGNIEEAKRIRNNMRSQFQPSAFEYMLSGMIAYQEGNFNLASTMFQNSVDMSPSQEGYYRLAMALNRAGNTESALSNLRRILDSFPQHASALHLTAQILFDQGRLDDAQAEAERLVSYYPDSASGFYLLGTILNAKGQTALALEALKKALEINPSMSEATMRLSSILMAEKRVPEAIDELSKSLDVNAGNVAVRTALFNYYMGKRDLEQADAVVSKGLEEFPENALLLTLKASVQATRKNNALAIETLGRALKSNPDFLPALTLLLRLHMLAGNNQEALAACNDYLSRHPDAQEQLVTSAALLDGLNQPDEARRRLEKANQLGSQRALVYLVRRELAQKNPERAEKYLVDKVKETPSQSLRSLLSEFYLEMKEPEKALGVYDALKANEAAEAAVGKYRIFMALGKFDQALLQAEEITRMDQGSSLGPISASGALERSGDKDKAFEVLDAAYTRLQDPQILSAIGNLCLRTGQYDKAIHYFRTALSKNSEDIQALMGQGYAQMQKKDFAAAVALYEKALELAPGNTAAANNLAMAIAEHGKDVDKAVDLATKAFVTKPENPQILDTLAFCLLADNRLNEALVILKNGIAAHPESGIIHYRYGVALLKNGQKKEGLDALEKALRFGNFSEETTARNLIREHS